MCHIANLEEEETDNPELPSSSQHPVTTDWRHEIKMFLTDGDLPSDKWAARRLRARSVYYTIKDGLFRQSATRALRNYLVGDESKCVIAETHKGTGGNHSGSLALAMKIRKLGFY